MILMLPLIKSINDMKVTKNKLINSINLIHDVKKKQNKKFTDIENKMDILSTKFEDFLNENKILIK